MLSLHSIGNIRALHISLLDALLIAYGFLSLSHITVQLLLAVIHHMRFRTRATHWTLAPVDSPSWPKVAAIVAAYNEDPVELEACLQSLMDQDYPDLEIMCVDDGSPKFDEVKDVYDRMSASGVNVIALAKNAGKRHAQVAALDSTDAEIIVTVDSDTTITDHSAIRRLVRSFDDPKVGAVTGQIGAKNFDTNLLTRIIGLRYWTAFNQERAAQSLFGVVGCCSGPFAAYRRSVVDRVRGDYTSQIFLGVPCTFGDDRHLTNLVLRDGWDVHFVPDAEAWTIVPEHASQYFRQQVRWCKSFYREALWMFAHVSRPNVYLWYDLLMQMVLPISLVGALVELMSKASPSLIIRYVFIMIGIGLLRVIYGLIRTRKIGFLLFAMFGLFYLIFVIPCRVYALATMTHTGWGTR